MVAEQRDSVGLALRVLALGLLATTCLTGIARANPAGGSVAAGHATISQPSATQTIITQSSSKALITWSSFSIPGGSSVTVDQPGSSSILVNRVTGGGKSLLFGSLTANGQIWLINGAGIVVGSGANITAAGLLLSTAGLSDFSAGNYNFGIAGTQGASVVNRGVITATDGSAVLAGEHVKNSGLISARLGTVALVGAKTYAVDFAGDGLLSFAITTPVEQVAPGTKALVENSGTLAAQGGTVLLTAAAAEGVIANVINTSGIVEATSVAQVNGRIVLSGAGGGTAVSGTLDASGKGAGQTGGTVEVLGDSVSLASGARIDVSGDAGGGTALVGGNFHGLGPEQNAQATTVAPGATIDADALTRGNGGKVAVWSNGTTNFAGSITARGGARGGNGGYVETSGAQLDIAGAIINVGATHGTPGTWLLDPDDLVIDSAGASAVESALLDGNVTIMTTEDSATPGFGTIDTGGNGDITVNANIIWSTANTLTLSAYRDINLNAMVMSTAGGVLIAQPSTGVAGGTLNLNGVPLGTLSGNLLVNGSFETGSLSGWTQTGNTGETSILSTDSEYGPQQGSYYLYEGPVGSNGVISQTFTDTPGQTLFLSGWVVGNGSTPSDFGFQFNGATVLNVNPVPSQSYTFYEVPVTATGHDAFSLFYRNDPSFDGIDNLAVTGCTGAACAQGTAVSQPAMPQNSPPPAMTVAPATVLLSTIVPPAPPVLTLPPPTIAVFAPPPSAPPSNFTLSAAPTGSGEMLVSVTNIDTGGSAFTQIAPGSGSSHPDPVTIVAPVTPAPQAQPKPQFAYQAVGGSGSNIFQSKTVFVPTQGVPGINAPASTSGNRSLWFSAGES